MGNVWDEVARPAKYWSIRSCQGKPERRENFICLPVPDEVDILLDLRPIG